MPSSKYLMGGERGSLAQGRSQGMAQRDQQLLAHSHDVRARLHCLDEPVGQSVLQGLRTQSQDARLICSSGARAAQRLTTCPCTDFG